MKTFWCLNLSLLGILWLPGLSQAGNDETSDLSYYFGRSNVKWKTAEKEWQSRGMKLWEVNSQEEIDFLTAQVAKLKLDESEARFWTSSQELFVEQHLNGEAVDPADQLEYCSYLTNTGTHFAMYLIVIYVKAVPVISAEFRTHAF